MEMKITAMKKLTEKVQMLRTKVAMMVMDRPSRSILRKNS
jgi:hypothetical protein